MDSDEPLFPQQQKTKNVNRDDPGGVEDLILATRDHAVIREWARVLCAEPATGVESPSGPATSMKVADGGSVLRFNFPGIGRFREYLVDRVVRPVQSTRLDLRVRESWRAHTTKRAIPLDTDG